MSRVIIFIYQFESPKNARNTKFLVNFMLFLRADKGERVSLLEEGGGKTGERIDRTVCWRSLRRGRLLKLATSSFRWLRTGPLTECGSRVPIMVLQTDVSGQKGYTATKFIPCVIESASSIVESHGKPSLNRRMH